MNKTLKIKWSNEWGIAFLFFGPQINYYLAALLSMNGKETATSFIYFIIYFVGVVSYFVSIRYKKCLISTLLLIITLALSVLINSDVSQYMFSGGFSSSISKLMLVYFPLYLLMINDVDFIKLMNIFRWFSYATIALALFAFWGYLFLHKTTPPDYMSFAYMMLTPIFVCFIFGTEGKIGDLVLSLIAAFIIFIVGCRGAVITMSVFSLLFMFFYYFPKGGKGFSPLKIAVLVGIVAIGLFSENILTNIANVLDKIGYTSRTVNKLLAGNNAFIESEGRQAIWSQAIHKIGIFGKGLFGDRTVITDEFSHSAYAHNLLLELLIDFGWVFGMVAFILFAYYIIKAFLISYKSNDTIVLKMSFVMISILFAKHMISASFLSSLDFWFYSAFALNLYYNKNAISNNDNYLMYLDGAK